MTMKMCNKKYYNDANLSIFQPKIGQNVWICCSNGLKMHSFDNFHEIPDPFVKVRGIYRAVDYQNSMILDDLNTFNDSLALRAGSESHPLIHILLLGVYSSIKT